MEEKKVVREIDIIGLTLKVFKNKKSLYFSVGIATVIGLVVALCTPKTYTASVILAPEMSSGGIGLGSTLSSMASTFGFDIDTKSNMDAIYPEIYPEIFESVDFLKEIYTVPVRLYNDNTTRTYIEHLSKDLKMPFWDYPQYWLSLALRKPEPTVKGQTEDFVDPFRITKLDAEICEGISKSISCVIDKKTSEISISFTDQDPMVAAIVVDTLQHRLQAYITDYRTKKARIDYEYYEKLANEAYAEYKATETAYSTYSDSHRNAVISSVTSQRDALENKMNNAFSAYSTMCNLRDQAKAKIQERTPAFTMIQSAKMPHKPSSRPKIVTLFIFMFVGLLVDVAWVGFGEKLYLKRKQAKEQA